MDRNEKLAIQQRVIAAWEKRYASDPTFNAENPTPKQADDLQMAMAVAMGKDSPEFQWLDAVSKMTQEEREQLIALYQTLKK